MEIYIELHSYLLIIRIGKFTCWLKSMAMSTIELAFIAVPFMGR